MEMASAATAIPELAGKRAGEGLCSHLVRCGAGRLVSRQLLAPNGGEILARVEQTLSRRLPAIAATFGRP